MVILLASFSPRSLLPSTKQMLKSAYLNREQEGLVATSDRRGGCLSPGKRSWREKRIQKKGEKGEKHAETETRKQHLYNRKAFGNQSHY